MELPKRYDAKISEGKWQKYWDKNKIFRFDSKSKKPIYSIDTPPPYASSDHLHVGHAMHYSQFEFVARFKRMSGYNVLFPMGFDDNGLPTERFVEKKHGVNKSNIKRSEFIKLCVDETQRVGKVYKQMWDSLGISVDWSLLYTTINPLCQRVAQRSFIDLYNKKRLNRVEEPVMWCTKCQTALAQADLEDLQRNSKFSNVKFKFKDDKSDIIIATTRPELIPACVALFVHPADKRYKGHVGKKAVVPIFNYEIPILTDESVAMDIGTGFMMVCTWGDVEDVEKWKKYDLDTRLIIDEAGKLNELTDSYAGLTLEEARNKILDDLNSAGLIFNQEIVQQVTNVHERCNTPIEFYHTPQWFIKILDKKKELIKQVNKINWYPDYMKVRAINWIENLKWDWCISRQRFYGIPFPVWYCEDCGAVILPDDKDLPVNPVEEKPKNPCKCGCKIFIPEKDVMDTWMASSMTPQIALKWGEKSNLMDKTYPMSLRPQGHDIIRTWAFYTIIKSYYHENSIPWNDIMISGHGQDPKGKKMSKSWGNVVTVNEAIEKYSSDSLRFWAAGVKLGDDLPYQEKDLLTGQKFITKLWNASKFVFIHLEGYDLKPGKKTLMDNWLLSKLNTLIKNSTESFKQYEYVRTKAGVEKFFWHSFCDYYLEIVKHKLYNSEGRDSEVAAAKHVLYNGLLTTLKLMAPIMPHITEELYQARFAKTDGNKSIHVSDWPKFEKKLIDEKIEAIGDLVIDIIAAVRKHKSENNLSMKEKLDKLVIQTKKSYEEIGSGLEVAFNDLKETLSIKEIVFGKADQDLGKIKISIS